MAETKKTGIKSFPFNYWVTIMFEFFERGSYYGMMSVLSVYMTEHLGFAKGDVGLIKGTIQPLLYLLPIITGAIADKLGYRKTLMVAFTLLGGGYFLTSQMTEYTGVYLSLMIMGVGAGTFKPVISGSIAKMTDESNSALGFGIFYWTINLGAFLFPAVLVPLLKQISWEYVIIASAIGTGAMILPTIFLFKEPPRVEEENDKDKKDILQIIADAFKIILSPFILSFLSSKGSSSVKSITLFIIFALNAAAVYLFFGLEIYFLLAVAVIIDFIYINLLLVNKVKSGNEINIMLKFLLFAAGSAVFWLLPETDTIMRIIYNVIFLAGFSIFRIDITDKIEYKDAWKFLLLIMIYSMFWILYFQMFDAVLWYLKDFVDTSVIDNFVNNIFGTSWNFDVEHVTAINAATIIGLQILVSWIVAKTKALPTMLTGIAIGTLGITILAFSSSAWFMILGIFIFSIGEMTAHPKFISYLGLSAPPDKKALYMGYGFLYGVFGSGIGAPLGAYLYEVLMDGPRISYIKEQLVAKGSDIVIKADATMKEALEAAETIGLTKMDLAKQVNTSDFWLIFTGIGVLCIVGLITYQKVYGAKATD